MKNIHCVYDMLTTATNDSDQDEIVEGNRGDYLGIRLDIEIAETAVLEKIFSYGGHSVHCQGLLDSPRQ